MTGREQGASSQAAALGAAAALGSVGARAALVNRTHRLVRERAELLHSQQRRSRSLLVPMVISAALCVLTALAIWSLLNQYGESYERSSLPIAIPDASNQFLVILLWFLPVTTALVALTLLRRARADRETR